MSQPRIVNPGTTYSVTRRCFQQRWLLKPGSAWLKAVVEFLLAAVAFALDIEIHGWTFMSNHFHLVLTDPFGNLPLFMERFDNLLARTVNRRLNRKDSVFESGSYTAERIDTQEDLINKLAYIACNPVAAGIVSHPSKWIGAISLPDDYRRRDRTVRPPKDGLNGNGRKSSLGDEAVLELTVPEGFKSDGEFIALYENAVNARLAELREEIKCFTGVSALRGIDPDSIPRKAKRGPSFELQPTLANSTKATRTDIKLWREAYRDALEKWKEGDRTVVFPSGTWKMRVLHKANVAGALNADTLDDG